jgi:hypothetical protein
MILRFSAWNSLVATVGQDAVGTGPDESQFHRGCN